MKEAAMELERVQSLRNPVAVLQDDEEIDRIRTGSICPSGAVSTSTRSEADVELTLLEEDQSLFSVGKTDASVSLEGSPFVFSQTKNSFAAVGGNTLTFSGDTASTATGRKSPVSSASCPS
ncbi:hypothetical protein NL676_008083 [Syzygium grande]|nr:hypothetical protein NL676_008083 [Syzygium grande]